MLTKLLKRYTSTLYVQIWEDRLKVIDSARNKSFDDSPIVVIQTQDSGRKVISSIGKSAAISLKPNEIAVNPFSHPRALLSDFYVGEKLLQHAFKSISNAKFLRPRPKVIIHPMEKTEGGLTAIEKRAFTELALGAGAVAIKIHVGKTLDISELEFDTFQDEIKIESYSEEASQTTSNVATLLVYLVIVIIAVWYFGN
ncbi:rod shape-determining protein MreB [Alteromonas genovensis]|uniref:Rod shape-determining protein MreB n=1 Tax=Alteromonas genovensis TaxID=471225 RepID=A0A6N9TH84_9ALTE|nr:rod shape-determining protein [Alteromonas genovensis]NDW16684.1 rod shape-determining protein MreB [Alteromonas genovensis]